MRLLSGLLGGLMMLALTSACAENMPNEAESAAAGKTDAVQKEETFDIMEIQVEGNSVLTQIAIEEAVYPFLGEKKSIKEVENARQALEKAYHDAGYLTVFVDIPEQQVNEGTVRLKATEGKVERLKVSGSRYFSLGRIKSRTPELAEGSVPYFPEVEKQVSELARNPDRKVTPILRPGRSPGKVEVELKVADEFPLHGNLELNNRYSAGTTHTRLSGSLRYDNLWQREHSVSLQFQAAPENPGESKVFSANYVWPLAGGDVLALYGVRSNSDTVAVGDVGVIGNGRILGARFIHPLRGMPGFYHSATAGWDYKAFKETVNLLGSDSLNTPITYQPFTLAYDATWQNEQRMFQLSTAFNFSVRGLGNQEKEFSDKRYNANPNYSYLRLDLKHTEKMASGWSLFGRLLTQLTSAPLISNEQFGAGGADSVRGYLETEVLGDRGALGSLELRTPSFWQGESGMPGQAYMVGFIEGAHLEVLEPLASQQARFTLSSSGLGMRWKAKGYTLNLDLAKPFKDTNNTKAEDVRVHARMLYEF
ncbi:hypothetical protein SCT_0106 [Sulfuricella sp. T08]|uniref:ShlB/FhaC/HecB family hemolysin secretion/activation protein n=1 Tax=Sulfuricella sp. T08 TaxID=1632857 RepID=UPI000617992F|nr:POTRA domain-containing protein [Sulfuricella sp. T08]GAO34726.1 hypothetical protein SCT_0106 [Sulfuricella sp. T08]